MHALKAFWHDRGGQQRGGQKDAVAARQQLAQQRGEVLTRRVAAHVYVEAERANGLGSCQSPLPADGRQAHCQTPRRGVLAEEIKPALLHRPEVVAPLLVVLAYGHGEQMLQDCSAELDRQLACVHSGR